MEEMKKKTKTPSTQTWTIPRKTAMMTKWTMKAWGILCFACTTRSSASRISGTFPSPRAVEASTCLFTNNLNRKCTLKDGVLTVNGKEYVFHKATGEYEW